MTVGNCLGLSDDPEKSHQNKTLRTRKLYHLVLHNLVCKPLPEMEVDTLRPDRTLFHLMKPAHGDNYQRHTSYQ